MVNEEDNREEDGSPFKDMQTDKEVISRVELMKLTAKELAKKAEPKSTLRLSTLEKLAKADLCDIILDIKKADDKPKARAERTQSESDNIINFALDILQNIKISREGQESKINQIAKDIFKSSAISKVDEARAEGTLNNDTFNNLLMFGSGIAIVIDSVVGFNNIPTLFQKLKAKVKGKS